MSNAQIFFATLGAFAAYSTLTLIVVSKTVKASTAEMKEHITATMLAHIRLEHQGGNKNE